MSGFVQLWAMLTNTFMNSAVIYEYDVYSERVFPDGCSLALPAELATFCLRATLPRALGVPFWKSIAFFSFK